jgi:meso-butanediol dehydrogenase / (S,S)-butanediol dehydrogenase / diacetyl reductase
MSDPRVLMIGSTTAIGRAIVAALCRDGCRVVGVSLDPDDNAQLAAALVADCADPAQAAEAVRRAVDLLSGLDVLVDAAGAMVSKPLPATDDADWRRVLGGTTDTLINTCRAAIPLLDDGGAIIAISSTNASRPAPWVSLYAAGKAAVEGLVRALAVELGPRGIRVNAVAPGLATGATTPDPGAAGYLRGSAVTPTEVAEVVAFLASNRSTGISGAVIPVDAAFGVVPASTFSRPDLAARIRRPDTAPGGGDPR